MSDVPERHPVNMTGFDEFWGGRFLGTSLLFIALLACDLLRIDILRRAFHDLRTTSASPMQLRFTGS